MRKVDLALWADYDVIGRAKEFEERVQAENEEFNALWAEMRDRSYLLLTTEPDTLRRYERMLELSAEGSPEDRQRRIFAEWNRRVIWTERTLREYLDRVVGTYELRVIHEKYTVEFTAEIPRKWAFLHKRLREIIPANLGISFRTILRDTLYFSGLAQSYRTLTVDWNHVGDTETESKLTLGGAALVGRTLTVPTSAFDRSKVDGTIRTGGWIGMRRLIVCSTDR